jgi:hypothetical protein
MDFKQWLLFTEKAERTSSKVPLYPVLYHTKQYSPLYHTVSAADYAVWFHAKLKPFVYHNYKSIFGRETITKSSE